MMTNGNGDIHLRAFFFNPDTQDRVTYTINNTACQGLVLERLYSDGPTLYHVRTMFCDNWAALNGVVEFDLPLSAMEPLFPADW